MEDALTLKDDEGGGVTALSCGEPSSRLGSGDIRMGKPNCVNRNYSVRQLADGKYTWRSETSQYPEEKK